MRHARSTTGALVVGLLVAALTLPLSAGAVSAPGPYPSWAKVEAAKNDVAAKKALIQRVDTLLTQLHARADSAGDAAVTAQATAASANRALASARRTSRQLATQVRAAAAARSTAANQVGALVGELGRGGIVSAGTVVALGDAPDLTLRRLSSLAELGDLDTTLLEKARQTSRTLVALRGRSDAATKARRAASTRATAAATQAQAASASADAAVTAESTEESQLYARLAALQDTTTTLERKRATGQAQAAAYAQQQAAAAKAAAAAKVAAARQAEQAREAAAAKDAAARKAAAAAASSSAASSSSSSSTSSSSSSSTTTTGGGGGSGGTSGTATSGSGSTTTSSGAAPAASTSGELSATEARAYAESRLASHGWSGSQYTCLVSLWNQESGWNWAAYNASSGAYGIPQSLPGSKMATAGSDWRTDARTQITWGLGYIAAAYGSPCGAWAHEVAHNWY